MPAINRRGSESVKMAVFRGQQLGLSMSKKKRAMGLLDFSYTLYLKAVSVKSPGLKKLNLTFSDTLMSTSTLAQSQP